MPPALGRFSTVTGWPSELLHRLRRDARDVIGRPRGAKGHEQVDAVGGYCWAAATRRDRRNYKPDDEFW
jgi:hypothetical protein